ncbi:MAG: Lon family ATP-dependent protease [Halanaerobiales bacterium]
MNISWRGLFNRDKPHNTADNESSLQLDKEIEKRIEALYNKVKDYFNNQQLLKKARGAEALELISSDDTLEKFTALERILYQDPSLEMGWGNIEHRIEQLEHKIGEILAERSVERDIEQKIVRRMKERQREYLQEVKKEVVSSDRSVDNAGTLKKLVRLEKLEERGLETSALEIVRPRNLDEVVGQKGALKSLLSKIASPYPQHVILYGPPGVGKTTAARLALKEACQRENTPFSVESKFVEVDGSTLRWDPRESTNPLLGSVHDPIYQGASEKFAKGGIPEPRTGLVTEAHGGILFIDEIGELDPILQNKLLKVLEDKRVNFESSYYDETREDIPQYIRKLFEEGAPADFILIGATTRPPVEINPAFRSRSAAVYFNPLNCSHIERIVDEAAAKLGVEMEGEVPEIISRYTVEGRRAINLLLDAYSLHLYEDRSASRISAGLVREAIDNRRLTPRSRVDASSVPETGKICGLGVNGFMGTVLEIEAACFPVEEREVRVRFNESAGSMARDSLFNAASVIRKLTGERLDEYDLHVNVVGGGNIDGPSAGLALLLAAISVITGKPLRQDTAVTGEISLRGKVKPVGGIREKVYAAEQAGMKFVLIPEDNRHQIGNKSSEIEIVPVGSVEKALGKVLAEEE